MRLRWKLWSREGLARRKSCADVAWRRDDDGLGGSIGDANDGGGESGSGAASTPTPAPAATPAPAQSSGTQVQAGTPAGGPGTQPGQPTPQQAFNFREQLRTLGMDPSQYADDHAAWNALQTGITSLSEQRRQADELARHGQYYLANKAAMDAAVQARQVQPGTPAAAATEQKWWNPPEWNEEWERYLVKDPKTGQLVSVMGADPSLPLKYQQHRDWQATSFKKLMADPIGTLKPGLEPLVKEMAMAMVKEHLSGYDDRQFANQFVQGQAQAWAFQKDANGQVMRNQYTGQPVLAPAGQAFVRNVQAVESLGIKDVRAQQQLATILTEYEAMKAMMGQQGGQPANPQQAAAATNQQQKQQTVAGGNRSIAARHPSTPAATDQVRPNTPGRGRGKSLRERLTESFQKEGVA